MIPQGQDLLVHDFSSGPVAWSASHTRCPQRLTSNNRAVRRSRVAAGDTTCLSKPAAPGPTSGPFRPVLWMTGRNNNVGESCSIVRASRNTPASSGPATPDIAPSAADDPSGSSPDASRSGSPPGPPGAVRPAVPRPPALPRPRSPARTPATAACTPQRRAQASHARTADLRDGRRMAALARVRADQGIMRARQGVVTAPVAFSSALALCH